MKWINFYWKWFIPFGICFKVVDLGVPGIKLKTTNFFPEANIYPDVHAVIGSTISLPCNLTLPSSDDSFSAVLWYRTDIPNPIYTLDARSSTGAASHFANEVLGGRSRFNVSPQRPTAAAFTLENVKEEDAGEYRCRVDFKRARTRNSVVKLNVIVPTKSLVIKDKDNKTLSGTIGPFKEGSSLILICEAQGGKPLAEVSWWRDMTELLDQSSDTDVDKGMVRNELLIETLKREDLLAQLSCKASNTNLTKPATTTVELDISLNPTDVQIVTPQAPISAGERIEVTCESKGSRPPAKITWWKDGKDLKRYATDEIVDDTTISKLFFVPTSDDNDKILTCRAENPENTDSALEDQWILNVYYAPILVVTYGASQQHEHVREGTDVHLECNILSNPPAADISWRFKSRPLLHDASKGIIHRNHSLILQNVRRYHRGHYRCLAANIEGESISDELNLRVQYSPVCAKGQKSVYGVARHEDANVSCAVDADPAEVAFRWTFNNSIGETIDILSYNSDGASKSIARYIPRTRLDYGQLYCFAKNTIGVMKEPCVFMIIPTGPPEAVQNCSITNQTSSVIMLSCDAGDDGGLPQTFHLEVYSTTNEQLITNMSVTETPIFIAERLSSSSSYIIVLYASNSKGRSTTVVLTAQTLFSAEPRTSDNQPVIISAILVVLMGTIGALVFLAISIIFIMKARGDRRGKQEDKNSEEKSTNQAENVFDTLDGKQADIFSKNFQTEYVDLTPNARTERIYESLGDCKEYTYENVIHKPHYPSNQARDYEDRGSWRNTMKTFQVTDIDSNSHSHPPLPSIVTR